jgi:carboxyl-terminal processing protease
LTLAIGILLAVPCSHAQVNLNFESRAATATSPDASIASVYGWDVRGAGTNISIDDAIARSGEHSLRVATQRGGARNGFTQDLDARNIDGNRLQLSGFVKVEANAPVEASLRVRIDDGGRLLYIGREQAAGDEDADGWRHISIDAPIATRAERISIGGDVSGPGVVWFDDLAVESLDVGTLAPPSPAAARYVRRALAIIEENAVTRAELDWPRYRDRVMAQAHGAVTVSDAHLAVQFALGELNDGHSYFMSPRQMSRLDGEPVGNARSGRQARAPRAELLAGSIGYVRLPGFAGGDHIDRVVFAEDLQKLIAEIDAAGACRWIVDLRDNQGGNLWPMLAGLGPLLGNGEVGASIRPNGERRSIWYEDGKVGLGDYVQLRVRGDASTLRDTGAPIAVLLDDETASAAEIVAAAFASRPATRSFGTATRGATTATRTFDLIDGAALMLAVASTVDGKGRILNGPIEPDELVVDSERGLPLADQAVVQAARRWLDLRGYPPVLTGCARLSVDATG